MVKESAFGCNSVQSPNAGMYCSRFVTAGEIDGRGVACHLCLARCRARVAPQAGETAHGLAEHSAVLADETHVAIVSCASAAVQKRRPMPRMKSLLLVAIENDGVQHAQCVAAGVEIQPQREGQPGTAGHSHVCLRP